MKQRSTTGSNNYSVFFTVLVLFYAILIGGLVVLRVLFNHYNDAFNNGFSMISHTRNVIESTDSMSLLAQNLAWEHRNFVLTADSNYYYAGISIRYSLQKKSNRLMNVIKADSITNKNAQKLQKQITKLVTLTSMSIQPEAASKNRLSQTGVAQTAEADSVINELQLIKAEANSLLVQRRAELFKTVGLTRRIFVLSNILMLILLIASFMLIYYHFRRRQKTERKLIDSENRFSTLINGTKDLAIFMIDKDGMILNWYEGAHKIKGYRTEEVIGKHISLFYPPEAVANGEPEHNLQLAAVQGSLETQGWRVRKDGSMFWADVLITAIYDENGKLKGFTKVTRDFTLHKRAEEKSHLAFQKEKELNEIKSNFVSMASHEFRTPLSTILSSVSLMEFYKTTETQDKRDKHIHRIKSAVDEMVATLEEFLSLEKIEEGKVSVKNETFNIRQLAENIRSKFNAELKNNQTIEYLHTGAEHVCLDEGFLNHILSNLLSNAIKYSPENSSILFDTRVENTTIVLRVKDNGIGISPEDQKHLFERFFRASNTGNIKGTGLGLHIVKRYVELLGGAINVKSTLNEGTEFTVKI
ncbi:MAG: ATP-binding protein [Ginsengibacter sp.]|jgi:PAS domain S-box-containing protein